MKFTHCFDSNCPLFVIIISGRSSPSRVLSIGHHTNVLDANIRNRLILITRIAFNNLRQQSNIKQHSIGDLPRFGVRRGVAYAPRAIERRGDQMENMQSFFDFAAYVGLTKHLGGVEATEELARLCHISKGKYILDVGCGAGVTPIYLAKNYCCRVVGVDISEGMIERSNEKAISEGVVDKVEFKVAGAEDLPFEDNLFDAVITESVTAFPEDKQKAVNEYVRVTKPGGYVGLNETTWLKVPPPPELIEWASQDQGATVEPLTSAGWSGLLESAGLREIIVRTSTINTQTEARGILQRYGCRGMLGILRRTLSLYVRNPAYRNFVKDVREGGIAPDNLDEFFGYGLYVGRK